MLLVAAPAVVAAVSPGAMVAGPGAISSPESEPAGSTDPREDETSPPDTTGVDTVGSDNTPSTAAPDATTADTVVVGDAVVVDEETSVSVWWWIFGGLIAVAAVSGVAYSLRRRNENESWAHEASAMCDTGRAMSLTISGRLDTDAPWSRPTRFAEQQQRFASALSDLADTVPEPDFPALIGAVSGANERLNAVLAEVADGTPVEHARATIQPALDELATSLSALEHESTITVFGAAMPSSRTTG